MTEWVERYLGEDPRIYCEVGGCNELAPYYVGQWGGPWYAACKDHHRMDKRANARGPIWTVAGHSQHRSWAEELIEEDE